jgi:hypothetical protein
MNDIGIVRERCLPPEPSWTELFSVQRQAFLAVDGECGVGWCRVDDMPCVEKRVDLQILDVSSLVATYGSLDVEPLRWEGGLFQGLLESVEPSFQSLLATSLCGRFPIRLMSVVLIGNLTYPNDTLARTRLPLLSLPVWICSNLNF